MTGVKSQICVKGCENVVRVGCSKGFGKGVCIHQVYFHGIQHWLSKGAVVYG